MTNDEVRFWSKVKKTDGCWIWTGCLLNGKYGRFRFNGKSIMATHFVMPTHKGLFVCHKCDNPPCVRPDHLFLGTHKDNMQDMVKKGRINCASGLAALKICKRKYDRGEKINTSKLTESDVKIIKSAPFFRGIGTILGKKFGVNNSTITGIISGNGWNHVKSSESDKIKSLKIIKSHKKNPPKCRKISQRDAEYIRNNYKIRHPKFNQLALSAKFGIHQSAIWSIINGRTYKPINATLIPDEEKK